MYRQFSFTRVIPLRIIILIVAASTASCHPTGGSNSAYAQYQAELDKLHIVALEEASEGLPASLIEALDGPPIPIAQITSTDADAIVMGPEILEHRSNEAWRQLMVDALKQKKVLLLYRVSRDQALDLVGYLNPKAKYINPFEGNIEFVTLAMWSEDRITAGIAKVNRHSTIPDDYGLYGAVKFIQEEQVHFGYRTEP